jgi:CDP-diacylglycerol--glycerol-3-phosphate 3-phosphatidyltransferase
MNKANQLTLSRIVMIPFFLFFLLYQDLGTNLTVIAVFRCLALVTFLAAAVTDYIDGLIARRYAMITNFGRLMDPLADKLMTAAAFVAFVDLRIFPSWIIIIILSREFIVTGLRTLGTNQNRIIHADRWGKHKTLTQFATVVATLIFLCGKDVLTITGHWDSIIVKGWGLDWWLHLVLKILLYVCAVLTIFSGAVYLVRNLDLISDKE